MQNKEGHNKPKTYGILIFLFILSIVIRFILALKYGEMTVFYDELCHWKFSQSISENSRVFFRNFNLEYSEILYSAIISMVHMINDVENAYMITKLINCILMSSSIFPIYLMSYKILKNRKLSIIISIIGIQIPEMAYTMKVMQENLYYPMFMWFWFILISMFEDDRLNNKNVIMLSLYIFVMSICKQMALNILIGLIVYYIISIVNDKGNEKKNILQLLLLVGTFLALRELYVNLFNSLNHTSGSISNSIVSSIKSNIFNFPLMTKLIYPAFTYILMIMISFGIYTIIIPISFFSQLDNSKKNIIIVIISIILSTIGVICLQIIPNENLGDTFIRMHLRYVYYMFIPSLILFVKCFENLEEYKLTRCVITMLLIVITMLIFINIIPVNGFVEAPSLHVLSQYGKHEVVSISVKIIIIIGIIVSAYLLSDKKIKTFYILIISIIVGVNIINTISIYETENGSKNQVKEIKNEALMINNYLKEELKENNKDVLIIANTIISEANLEVYLSVPYYVALKDDFSNNINSLGEIQFSNIKLQSLNKTYVDKNFKLPYYIISKDSLNINGYDLINLNLNKYKVYKQNGSKVSIKYTIQGRYDDMWIGKEYEMKIYDESSKNEVTLELKMDAPALDKNIIRYQDGSGISGEIVVNRNEDIYTITLKRNNNDPFALKLVADKTFKPEGADNRDLSVRILDVKIE